MPQLGSFSRWEGRQPCSNGGERAAEPAASSLRVEGRLQGLVSGGMKNWEEIREQDWDLNGGRGWEKAAGGEDKLLPRKGDQEE